MKLLTTLIAFTFFATVQQMNAQNTAVTATVTNATSDSGKVYFSLYNQASFMKKPLKSGGAIIAEGKSSITFEDLAPGTYAIVCYHDKNDNKKMDFSPNGMPEEDYGASNNVLRMGPPQFTDAKFTVTDKNVSLEIRF